MAKNNLTRRSSLTREIRAGLYILSSYNSAMERLLARGQQTLLDKIQRDLGPGVSLDSVNPMVARDFPRYLRYSFIALLIAFVESQLAELCVEVGKPKGLSAAQVKDSLKNLGKVKKAKDFLKKNLQCDFSANTRPGFLQSMDQLFDPVLSLVRVRNCVLHAEGNISKLKRKGAQEELRKLVKRKCSGFHIDNQFIVLEQNFCKVALSNVQNLFGNLFHLVG